MAQGGRVEIRNFFKTSQAFSNLIIIEYTIKYDKYNVPPLVLAQAGFFSAGFYGPKGQCPGRARGFSPGVLTPGTSKSVASCQLSVGSRSVS
jgi:hypothetical protein